MFKMSIAWLIVYFGGLALSFLNPLFGLFTYLFEYYLRPSLHWWGEPLPDWRWNLMVSGVLCATYLMHHTNLPPLPRVSNPAAKWLVAFVALTFAISVIAVDPNASLASSVYLAKLVVLYALIIALVRTEWAFDLFVTLHVLGAGWWGWEAYTHPKRVSGRLLNVGSGDTFGDNATASQLLVVLPFLVVYGLLCKDKRIRGLMVVAAPFIINLFILCNSRGALVGLLAAVLVAFVVVKSGHRLRFALVTVGLAGALLYLADPQFIERQQTTTNYEQDSSARGRLDTWRGSLDLVRDYPFGSGGLGVALLSPRYIPEVVEAHNGEIRAPHNTVVLIASEWGVLGLILFAAFLVSTFLILRDVRKRSLDHDFWFYRSVAVTTALTGLLVSGLFTDRLYAEAPFWMAALAVSLRRIQARAGDLSLAHVTADATVPPPSAITATPAMPLRSRTAQALQRSGLQVRGANGQ